MSRLDDKTQETLAPLVRTVLLRDRQGSMQVMLVSDWLLDLEQLQEKTGRDLAPLPAGDLVRATHRNILRPLNDAPGCFLLPTVIDRSVGEQEYCRLQVFDVDQPASQTVALGDLMRKLEEADYRVQQLECAVAPRALDSEVAPADSDSSSIMDSIRNFTALRIRQRLEETLEIPPLPPTAERIIRLRSNRNATVEELTEVVESDPSLAAQVMSWASSPYYAASRKIESVKDAIVRVLGFDMVSNLAVGLALGRTTAQPDDRVAGFTPYWQQAVYCSTATDAIFRLLRPRHRPRQGLVYLAGLLHNFGYLVMAHTFPPQFSRICRYIEANPGISHVAIEHHLLGLSREQISAWLIHCWNMPEELCVALRQQHAPEYRGEHAVYAHLVCMALRLLRQHGIGDAPPEPVPGELYRLYGLDREEVEEAVARVAASREVLDIADTLSASSSPPPSTRRRR